MTVLLILLATLLPVDEAPTRPDFFTFRAHLQSAIARHDVSTLLDAVDPQIKTGFGGDDGIEAFKRQWRIAEPDSELWAELGDVLALGGSFDNSGQFFAPYTFSEWPGQFDAFEQIAVIGENVRVRSQPRPDGSILNTVSFEILRRGTDSPDPDWTAVTLDDGRNGFIASRFVRSPIDYRAAFRHDGVRWRLITFLAGD